MNEAATTHDPATLERAVRAAKSRYPDATVKVRRGRIVIVHGDLIGLLPVAEKAVRAKPRKSA